MPSLSFKQTAELPSKPLPIVSIGMGDIVDASHYPAYRLAGLPVAGGYDLNPERAAWMQQKYGVPKIYSSIAEAAENAPEEAVFDLAVPGKAILNILPLLPDGRAVLIQKPMGETLAEARAILALCREKRLTAAINFQLRYAPNMIAARDLIMRGIIGELVDVETRIQVYTPWSRWTFLHGIPRLEMLYHSIHYIDLIRSFLGDPQRVYAKCLTHPLFEGYAGTRSSIILDYGDQVRVQLSTNHAHIYGAEKQESYIKWEGSKGAIQARMGVNMDYPTGIPDLFEYSLLEDNLGWRTADIKGTWMPHAFIGTMASLQRYVLGESEVLPTSVEDSIKTMMTVEAAYISSERDGTTLLDL